MTTKPSVCKEKYYKKVFDDLSEPLYRFLLYKYGDDYLARDIMQEAFIKLWTNCETVALEKAKAFLFTVANNKMIDELRRLKRQQEQKTTLSTSTEKNTPEYILEEKEFEHKLNSILAGMPENYRIPFLLNRIEDKKYKEIAEILDISVKAVEKRMYNALQYLKANLQVDKKSLKKK